MGEQLDWRSTIYFVQYPAQNRLAGRLGIDDRKVHVSLSLASPVRDVSLHLESSNHTGDARVRQVRVDPVPDLGNSGFTELPEHTHYVQLALGEMEIAHREGAICRATDALCATCAW